MPTYEYLCQTCSHRFETWQKMTDEPLTTCPTCGAEIRRVIFPAGVVFKGHGFYKTDYDGKNGKNGHGEPAATSENTNGETKKAEASNGSESKSASESSSNGSKPAESSTSSGNTGNSSAGNTAATPNGSKAGSTPAATK